MHTSLSWYFEWYHIVFLTLVSFYRFLTIFSTQKFSETACRHNNVFQQRCKNEILWFTKLMCYFCLLSFAVCHTRVISSDLRVIFSWLVHASHDISKIKIILDMCSTVNSRLLTYQLSSILKFDFAVLMVI